MLRIHTIYIIFTIFKTCFLNTSTERHEVWISLHSCTLSRVRAVCSGHTGRAHLPYQHLHTQTHCASSARLRLTIGGSKTLEWLAYGPPRARLSYVQFLPHHVPCTPFSSTCTQTCFPCVEENRADPLALPPCPNLSAPLYAIIFQLLIDGRSPLAAEGFSSMYQ